MLTSLVMFGFRAKFWAKDLGWGIKNAPYLYTILQLGQFLSSFIGGFLGDFFQRRFGDKGRIALFQIYCVAFAAMTFIAFPVKFSRGQYYVVAFMLGLVFSIGFSGCVLPMVASVVPTQLSATGFAVLFSLVQGCLTALMSLATGWMSVSFGLQRTLLHFVTIPYLMNAAFWFVFASTPRTSRCATSGPAWWRQASSEARASGAARDPAPSGAGSLALCAEGAVGLTDGQGASVRRRRTARPAGAGRAVLEDLVSADHVDVGGLGALGALDNLELHAVVLVEALEARALDGAEVREHVGGAVLGGDEAEALFGVEPLHDASSHVIPAFWVLSTPAFGCS